MATGTALVLGKMDQVSNHTMSVTRIDDAGGQNTNVLWLYVSDPNSNALHADAIGPGRGTGVVAYSASSGEGVRAFSDYGIGVYGEAIRGGIAGVVGRGTPDREGEGGVATVGVLGSGTYAGVWGFSEGHGVKGEATGGGTGVHGTSQKGAGVMGDAGKSGHAGAFFGKVMIVGDLDVQGAKGAAVPFPDGTLRRLYSMESPESWFEDFGEARLVNGKATVRLDAGFAAVVQGTYHVFITPYGDSNGLYVSTRSGKSFDVREQGRGKSTLAFSYRIVAKRKDIRGPRFVKVKSPERLESRPVPSLPTKRPNFRPHSR